VTWTGVVVWTAVAVAGGLGAGARFLVDREVTRRTFRGRVPWGTWTVNVSGSFAAGIVGGLATGGLPDEVAVVVAGGFLGAYTTFSTAMLEAVRRVEAGEPGRALGVLVLPLALATAAAACGWWLVAGR
jgi:fluoride exporter